MATETRAGLSSHLRGVTVTTLACLAGVAAGVASGVLAGTGAEAATDQRTLAVLAAFVLVQYPVLKLVGVDVSGFGAKDNLYVVFMTFVLWFVTLTILLTSGASL
jgi:F0F1-type ATP synthase membrane subunit c/vacuolar-type H+-ATPase subunit K